MRKQHKHCRPQLDPSLVVNGLQYAYRVTATWGDAMIPGEVCYNTEDPNPIWFPISRGALDFAEGWVARNNKAVEKGFPPHWRPCAKCKTYMDPANDANAIRSTTGRVFHRDCVDSAASAALRQQMAQQKEVPQS